MDIHKGLVIKSTGSWYSVLSHDGSTVDCRIKGKFRLEGLKSTNPIAVGDRVIFHTDTVLGYSVIDSIDKRKNFLIRKATNLSKQSHMIAANLDFTLIMTSLKEPRISTAFIDRYLVISSAYEIDPVIVFNKIDLLNEEENAELNYLVGFYKNLGYPVFAICAKKGEQLKELSDFIKGKLSLLSGQSGVGKSTLMKQLIPGLELKTIPVSNYTGKGQHATTFAEMHQVDETTFVIDSPGIRELGLWDFEPFEISLFFPEIKKEALKCRFSTCKHQTEPSCAVKKAVEEGIIEEWRYINYLKVLDDFK